MNDLNSPQDLPAGSNTDISIYAELLDSLDFNLTCEWERPGGSSCEAEAVWLGIFPCCDYGFQVCSFHQVHSEVAMAAGENYHTQCKQEIPHMEWISLS